MPIRSHGGRRGLGLTLAGASLALGLACGRSPERPSVALVVLDTVRRDFTSVEPGEESRTPHLARLAARSAVFPAAWAPAPWTVPSHASLFTGELPAAHGCTSAAVRLDPGLPTLAETLGRAGYTTAAFFSNPWLSDELTGLLRGFGERVFVEPGEVGQGGPEIVAAVEAWLGRRPRRPFFLFVNLLEAHAPYAPPPRHRGPRMERERAVTTDWILDFQARLHGPEGVDWERVRRLYGGDVRFADELLGALDGRLAAHVPGEELVLAVTSDHGENLGEHGAVEHQLRIDETLLAVPFLLRAPGRLAPGRRPRPVLLTDLFATLLDLAGHPRRDLPPHSRSLLGPPPEGPRPLPAEYAGPPAALLRHLRERNPSLDPAELGRSYRSLRLGDLRITVDDRGRAVLHDLAQDPAQERDLAAERPAEAERLRRRLEEVLGPREPPPRQELELDEESRERLRALGYVG